MKVFRLSIFLALRQLKRSSKWTSALIIFILTLTFINLVAVSGLLVGLVEGSSREIRRHYSSDILIQNNPDETIISQSKKILSAINAYPEVAAYSTRYILGGTIEANYRDTIGPDEEKDQVGAQIVGIDPNDEDFVTELSELIVAGNFLNQDSKVGILVGSNLIKEYAGGAFDDETIESVDIGEKVRMRIKDVVRDLPVLGIVESKAGQVSRRVYILDSELRKLDTSPERNYHEIAVKLQPRADSQIVVNEMHASGLGEYAEILTWQESQGAFFEDISTTFGLLGIIIGAIGVIASSITLFIVIFINAVTRQKYIGILKGIGVSGQAIKYAYIMLALVYALIGTFIGLLLTYGLLVPFFEANPIDFPFSDGILVAPLGTTLIRVGILLISSILAGLIPAWMIIRRNTLDSILGR